MCTHADNLNYAGVAVGIVLVGALISFFFPGVGAYKWYRGERHTIDDFSVSHLQAFPSPSLTNVGNVHSQPHKEGPADISTQYK